MEIISSREFRQHQRKYFDKVDQGMEVVIKRSNNKSYRMVPVREGDIVMSKADFAEKLDDAKSGGSTTIKTEKDLNDFFDAL